MNSYKETADLLKLAQAYQEFETTRDLMDLEDLEVYIYSIRKRFIEKEGFPHHFAEGYELIRKEAEVYDQQHKKYSREKYIQEEGENTEF